MVYEQDTNGSSGEEEGLGLGLIISAVAIVYVICVFGKFAYDHTFRPVSYYDGPPLIQTTPQVEQTPEEHKQPESKLTRIVK